MGALENENIYGIRIRESATDGSDFPNPPADYRLWFVGEDGGLHLKDSSGTVTDFPAGGGSGIPATIFDVKGDIIAASAADTAARLAAGANGLSLVTDSAQSTGLKWGYPTFVGASAYHNTTEAYTSGGFRVRALNSEDFDSSAFHDTSTNNSRMTIPSGLGGKYLVVAAHYGTVATSLYVLVNGTNVATEHHQASANRGTSRSVIVNVVATDYIEMAVFSASNGTSGGATADLLTKLQITYLGA